MNWADWALKFLAPLLLGITGFNVDVEPLQLIGEFKIHLAPSLTPLRSPPFSISLFPISPSLLLVTPIYGSHNQSFLEVWWTCEVVNKAVSCIFSCCNGYNRSTVAPTQLSNCFCRENIVEKLAELFVTKFPFYDSSKLYINCNMQNTLHTRSFLLLLCCSYQLNKKVISIGKCEIIMHIDARFVKEMIWNNLYIFVTNKYPQICM